MNMYPPMLLDQFLSPNGTIDVIEYSQANRDYANAIIGRDKEGRPTDIKHRHVDGWSEYATQMGKIIGNPNSFNFEKTAKKITVKEGSVYEQPLENERYDAITSFFVSESITDDMDEFQKALAGTLAYLKPGGVFAISHMLGSEGWNAGDGNFPAVSLTIDDLNKAYRSLGLEFENITIKETSAPSEEEKAREGYHGMAVVVGKLKE